MKCKKPLKNWKKYFVEKNIQLSLQRVYKTIAYARVAELVDALDSKSSDSNVVWVRFPPRVQKDSDNHLKYNDLLEFFLLLLKHH